MAVPGDSAGCAGGNGTFQHADASWILFVDFQGESGFDDGGDRPELLSERVNLVL
jgi:hypothetical protein